MNIKDRRQSILRKRAKERGSELEKAFSFFLNEGVSIQTLQDKNHFAIKDLDFKRTFPENKDNTGIKIKTGEECEDGTAVVVFDLDCKENAIPGLQLFLKMLERYEDFNYTRTEKTKSGGFHIFLRIPINNYKNVSKIIFNSPLKIERNLMTKPLEIEVFINSCITVAPTVAKDGKYELMGEEGSEPIREVSLETFQKILHDLQTNSIDFQVVNSNNTKAQHGHVKVDDEDIQESIEILKMNGIKFRIKGDKVSVWEKGDTSGNGDWLLNSGKKLWNLKDYSRMCMKDFIKQQNGGKYIERQIQWT